MHRSALRLLAALLLALGVLPLSAVSASAATYTIRGTVTGLSTTGAAVAVVGAYVEVQTPSYGSSVTVTTSSTGTYTATVSGPGPWIVHTWCPDTTGCNQWAGEWYGGTYDATKAARITVTDGTPFTANIRVDRWGIVKGKVVDDAGQAPRVPVRVWAWPAHDTSTNALADAAGNYTLSRVQPGSTQVYAQDSTGDRNYAIEYAQADGTSSPTASDARINVPAGPTVTTANFSLDRNQGLVVVATDTSGKPLPDLELHPWTRDAEGNWGSLGGELVTDEQGRAFPHAVIGDTVYLCLTDDRYNVDYPGGNPHPTRYNETCFGGATRDTATPVTITEANRYQKVTIPMTVAGSGLQPQAPFVVGRHEVGNTLTVDVGTWGPAPVALAIQWYTRVDGVPQPIAGATTSSFTIPAELQDQILYVEVTGTKAGYRTATLSSEPYNVGATTPTSSPETTIVGSAVQGQTLRAQDGTFSPQGDGSWTTHRWFVGGKLVAVGESLTLTSAHVGQKVSLRTEYQPPSDSWGNDLHLLTSTAGVVQGVLTAPTPTISGTRTVGYTLTAVPGTWGPAPVTLAYQWYRSGVAISGATLSTYKLTTYDQAKTITVKVTGTKPNHVTTARTSGATSAILGVFSAPVPTITGTRKVAYTLTANPATWTPAPSTFRYQWYRVTPSTGAVAAISGATARSYKLTSYDKGKYIRVRVTGARAGYQTLARTSSNTGAIA